MKKVLLFGASGHLGKEIAKELVHQSYDLTIVVRNESKASSLRSITSRYRIANVCDAESIKDICDGFEIVISALGKSVSLNDRSKPRFADVDLKANTHILEEAKRSRVRKFVYISALHAERYPQLEYFRVHETFSQMLMQSGIDYSIIKPPALFSAFIDLFDMARKGRLMNLGKGDKKTNPIYEGDLARIVVSAISQHNVLIEAGGKKVYSRRELNEIIQRELAPAKRTRTLPLSLVQSGLPLLKLINRNMYDKFSFFTEVMQHDTLAPQEGAMEFEEYVALKKKEL